VCKASNDPSAIEDVTFKWFDINNHNIINSNCITMSNTMETGSNRIIISTLTINPVIHQDAGDYLCVALNHPTNRH